VETHEITLWKHKHNNFIETQNNFMKAYKIRGKTHEITLWKHKHNNFMETRNKFMKTRTKTTCKFTSFRKRFLVEVCLNVVFENRVFRRIFGPKRDGVMGG
jgi:hypothetical protein